MVELGKFGLAIFGLLRILWIARLHRFPIDKQSGGCSQRHVGHGPSIELQDCRLPSQPAPARRGHRDQDTAGTRDGDQLAIWIDGHPSAHIGITIAPFRPIVGGVHGADLAQPQVGNRLDQTGIEMLSLSADDHGLGRRVDRFSDRRDLSVFEQ